MTALLNAVGQLYFFSFIMVLHTLLQQYSCHSGFKTTNVELKPSWQLYCFSRVLAPWFRRKRSWPTAVVVQSFRFPALLLANFFSCGHILIFSLISLNKVLFLMPTQHAKLHDFYSTQNLHHQCRKLLFIRRRHCYRQAWGKNAFFYQPRFFIVIS